MGKGSNRRPRQITEEQWAANYEAAFRKGQEVSPCADEKEPTQKITKGSIEKVLRRTRK